MESDPKQSRFYMWREIICTFALIIFYGQFVIRWSIYLSHTYNTSALLFVIYELIIVALVVIRNLPKAVSGSFYDWGLGLGGTLLPLLYVSVATPHEHIVFIGLQLVGSAVSFFGLISLYTSFGVIPANRGVRTTGAYKYIRHPLYSGYFMSQIAFVVQNFSWVNGAVFTAFCVVQVFRIRAEERFLSQDPAYQEFCQKVRWRILPYIW